MPTTPTPEWEAVEAVLKGIEVPMPVGQFFIDHAGREHEQFRARWWDSPHDEILCSELVFPPNKQVRPVPVDPKAKGMLRPYPADDCPVFFGHYFKPADSPAHPERHNVACLDHSAATGGPLVSYRWKGEEEKTEDEEDHTDDSDPNCYAFHADDSWPIGELTKVVRALNDRTDLDAETREQLRVFLFAMTRLPLITPSISMTLRLRIDYGEDAAWIEIRMEDDEFSLGRGTLEYGDANTETDFEVTTRFRNGDTFAASNFAYSFAECAEDVCREVIIDDFSCEPIRVSLVPQSLILPRIFGYVCLGKCVWDRG